MSKKKTIRNEYLDSKTISKAVYYFVDRAQGVKIKSREVYLKVRKETHYPFNRTGGPKYKKITEIIYQNLSEPLPRGIIKDWRLGYGFTKVLSPLLYALESKFDITKVIVKPRGKLKINGKVLYLSYADLNKFYPRMDSLLKTQSVQKEILVSKYLNQYFPKKFRSDKKTYVKGTIYSVISEQVGSNVSISRDDYDAMLGLVVSKLGDQTGESKKIVVTTREKIERRFLEDAVKEFKKNLSIRSGSERLEKRWEEFFKENTWIR